jgi:hypothetical protein
MKGMLFYSYRRNSKREKKIKKELWVLRKKKCLEHNGRDKLNWLNLKKNKLSKKNLMSIELFINRTKELSYRKRSSLEDKNRQIEL